MPESLISCGPWLTNPDVGRISIGFATSRPCAAYLEYRRSSGEPWKKLFQSCGGQILRGETTHLFHLDGLTPGACYEYRAGAFVPEDGQQENRSASFRVFDPERKQYSFMVLADLQFESAKRQFLIRKYHELCGGAECDFIVMLGDMCGEINCFEKDILEDHVDLLCKLGASARPVVFLRGNHELRGRESFRWMEFFGTPSGTTWSRFRHGPAAFLALDSWSDQPSVQANPIFRWNLDREFLEEEKRFIRKAVSSPEFLEPPFRIVLAHGASHAHIDQFNFLGKNMRNLTDEFFRGKNPQIPIHLWICGHIHHYLRSVPLKAECVSIHPPPQPVETPEEYSFPLITADGPVVLKEIVPPSGIQSSAFAVNVSENMLEIRALSAERGIIDHFSVSRDHRIVEKMDVPHFFWKSSCEMK